MASQADAECIFDEIDTDKDGLITFEEFLKFLNTYEIAKDETEAKSLFDVLDVNKDGKITLEEVKTIFSELDKAIEASLNKDN